jgi:hypothetical protein
MRRFPNGAIEIEQASVGEEPEHPLKVYASPNCGLEGGSVVRTLGPFVPKRFYWIQYPPDYQDRLKTECSFFGGESTVSSPAPGEFDLANLSVAVLFRGRVGKGVRRAFTDAVAAWGRAAAQGGAFEDGPVTLASTGVTFTGARAQFRIDASRSGQDTVNWLTLTILDFGYDVHPVTDVRFGHTCSELDTIFGAAKGERVTVEFSGDSTPAGPRADVAASPATYVPPEAKADASVQSKHFRVLTLPINEWDSFVATVYFADSPGVESRRDFVALVEAWLLLASYGGFGGRGSHSSDSVAFDDSTDSAVVSADMGDTDPRTALRVLIRSLEGFESGSTTAIDAVVFGSRGIGTERGT